MIPAERLDRLWASLIDRAILLPLVFGAAILMPATKDSALMGIALVAISVLVVLAYAGYQIYLLTTQGQTIGKRFMGVRIILVKDETNGGFVINVLLRGLLTAALSVIPFVGVLYALTDICFIFRDDRRCIHDHIAGTRVVEA